MVKMLFFLCLTSLIFSLEAILLLGPPGSGKGTFAQLAQEKGYAHISAGDLVRDEIYRKTELGQSFEAIVNRGDYIDPRIMFQLVKDRVLYYTAQNQPYIIDGYGRTADQAADLRDFLVTIGANVHALFLNASNPSCKERILTRLTCAECHYVCNMSMGYVAGEKCPRCMKAHLEPRLGDTPEVIERRLNYYRQNIEKNYQFLLTDLPTVYYNTDRDLRSCLEGHEQLLEQWKAGNFNL